MFLMTSLSSFKITPFIIFLDMPVPFECFPSLRQEEVLQRPIVYEGNTVPIPRVKVRIPKSPMGSRDQRIDKCYPP